ncbi:hypothetical protein GCM10010168_22100 [Actinoplanes ianthinogenes]|uniref:Uncharacterized protein n=1 Tax=Actinoplanes ianthinogenes TaxID=122358 RepID=A0ABM7M867_9ACTN|nr:hypothetical protein [Actinoplanes ianthinogenes]BCJ47851.1 hypothetical protein Aiant_85080 [Actinoplanes ianthinogenes]GGR04594.1 hypothetical protein GCM10010168_22100 [Actinoplanes ianthinogenes]
MRGLLDALLEAVMGLEELPPEPGTPERAEALRNRVRTAELEHERESGGNTRYSLIKGIDPQRISMQV